MKRSHVTLGLAAVLVVCVVGARKHVAHDAIARAESAFTAIRVAATHIAPDHASKIEDELIAARAAAMKGDFEHALMGAKDVAAKVKGLAESLPAREADLRSRWTDVSQTLPRILAELSRSYGAGRRAPPGMTKIAFEASRTELTEVKVLWTEAQTAARSGQLAEAVTKAESASQRAAHIAPDLHEGS